LKTRFEKVDSHTKYERRKTYTIVQSVKIPIIEGEGENPQFNPTIE
jgi:hypothetical protein